MQNPMSRVPFFRFENREHGADPIASKEKGYEVPRMLTFIIVLPHGSRGDGMEFIADEFIERKEKDARDGRYDHAWVKEFRDGLAAFREGKTLPRSGTPLINWERILKSRRDALAPLFPTLEDLAALPDSNLNQIGLDGRVIRDMAVADIQAKKDLSPIVKELADSKEENRRQSDLIEKLTKRLDVLEASAPRRGRPPNADRAAA